jgi:cyclophilin family peptidyl-prolyl cis-trans isomerase/HEAT repeat protein
MMPRIVLLLFFSIPVSLVGQSISEQTLERVLTAQDLRDVKLLQSFLLDSTAAVRAKAAYAAGSVQDTQLVPQLVSLLTDRDPSVRTAAAFALGQMNSAVDSVMRRTISNGLTDRLSVEDDEGALQRLIEGLGKTGDPPSLTVMLERVTVLNSPTLKGETALSIGRYAYRGIKNPAATGFATTLLSDARKDQKWKAAYALFRIGDRSLLGSYARQIINAVSDGDPYVRMYICPVLGRILALDSSNTGYPMDIATLLRLAQFDPDWRVRVNALKALGALDGSSSGQIPTTVIRAINEENEHVSLTGLSAMAQLGQKKSADTVLFQFTLRRVLANESGRSSSRQQREAALAYAKMFGQRAYDVLAQQVANGTLLKNSYVEALGFIAGENALGDVLEYAGQNDPHTQRLALEAIVNVVNSMKPGGPLLDAARSSLIDGLSSNDKAVVATAASALSDSLLADRLSVPHLTVALRRLNSSDDAEAMSAIIHSLGTLKAESATSVLTTLVSDRNYTVAKEAATALETISGISYKHMLVQPARPAHTNFDWTLLEWVRKHPVVDVKTSRGSFTIIMLPDEAPFTCINFASLIRSGFFNGLQFHRVVPNFVVQGGDPHGDGWGGPGYTIRSEFGYEHYGRGMVGVASSGKDTEGSQFFVTHSNQPHLDGRYTIFGRVSTGMDVVDMIQVGDTIKQMTFTADTVPSEWK